MRSQIITTNQKIKIPKVPYLQYEILEFIFSGQKSNIEEKVGYPKGSLIIKNAIKMLVDKGLINSDLSLSNDGEALVKKHYYERKKFPNYSNDLFNLNGSYQSLSLFGDSEEGNGNGPIFRWYKYLEDFPHTFIGEYIEKYKLEKGYYVLDPFAGSGTTLVRAKMDGYKSYGLDINPAMVFIVNQKLNWKSPTEKISQTYSNLAKKFLASSEKDKEKAVSQWPLRFMPKRELNQWLSPVKQKELALMSNLIDEIRDSQIKDFFRFLLTKTAIDISYVAFCPGTTFYPFRKKPDFLPEFKKLVEWVIADLQTEKVKKNINTEAIVKLGSIKNPQSLKEISKNVDVIITSPPYPNDLEYTRQTRLEMYMLGCVKSMDEVQKIKRLMVKGSTKLIFNNDNPDNTIINLPSVNRITKELRERLKDKNWGFDYPKMVEMYFTDMLISLKNCYGLLVSNGACILVVGDQTIKGVLIPVAKILAEISQIVGFKKFHIELHRKRRSTGHDLPIPEENLVLIK